MISEPDLKGIRHILAIRFSELDQVVVFRMRPNRSFQTGPNISGNIFYLTMLPSLQAYKRKKNPVDKWDLHYYDYKRAHFTNLCVKLNSHYQLKIYWLIYQKLKYTLKVHLNLDDKKYKLKIKMFLKHHK